MRRVKLLFLFILIPNFLFAQDTAIDKLFRSSYRVWELQRNEIGIYRDSKLFNGIDYHPCSVANVGIGLISLCIADSMNWDNNAMQKALLTLQSITGHTPGFNPDRNASGFYRHFIDMNTGEQHWNSEYSTIDTEILVAGALFAKNYFDNDSISKYALELWNSVEHEKAIADAEKGKIFLTMESNGEGTSNLLTSVYNEYMIVAWMAKNSSSDINSEANKLWNKYYADPDSLPVSEYSENRVLTDQEGYFLSSFTHQFNYFLCNYFTKSNQYKHYLKQAQQADSIWWQNNGLAEKWEWGCGAGTGPEGYSANKINDNANLVISPQIIAGFLPVLPEGKNCLWEMWQSKKGRYVFPNYQEDVLLWRYSLKNPDWMATEIQGIDYSTMLFGLASLPQFLGERFFERHNNFFANHPTKISLNQNHTKWKVRLYADQFADTVTFELTNFDKENVDLEILSIQQQVVYRKKIEIYSDQLQEKISTVNLIPGVYFLRVAHNGKTMSTKKFVKN